jgi:hypothetical protein
LELLLPVDVAIIITITITKVASLGLVLAKAVTRKSVHQPQAQE